jgi:hypothetical protein
MLSFVNLKSFPVATLGVELERVGTPENPVEGSNVTIICTTSSDNLPFMPIYLYYADYQYEEWPLWPFFPKGTISSSN